MKVGDKVLMVNVYGYRRVTIRKITPTGIYKLEELTTSFDKDGYERGADSFGRARIREITDKDIEMFEKILY